MKTKILLGIMSLAVGLLSASCDDDDDYSIAKGQLVKSYVTGSSDVTANSAVLHGTVEGLESQSSAAYEVGFYYGSSDQALTEKVLGSLDGSDVTAQLSNLTTNRTIYYQLYVTLQKTVTYKGEVKSLVTTDALAVTADAAQVTAFGATLGGSLSDAPADATCGIVIATAPEAEAVRAGVEVEAASLASSFAIEQAGLLPNHTYYYAAFLNVGAGTVYGDVKQFTTADHQLDIDNDFVDLGLSTKWCRYNLGAGSETELGGYFAFGALDGLSSSTSLDDYPVCDNIYRTANDVVNVTYGKATIPTADEYAELFACKHVWTEKDGVAGIEFTGPNGNTLFMPAAGKRTGSTVADCGEQGHYMTGSVNPSNSSFAVCYNFGSSNNDKGTSPRFVSLSVRPVTVAKNVPFKKEWLYNTWEIDLTEDGEYEVFPGPVYFYGSDDSWATVTNNEPIVGNSWAWEADFAGNSWTVGGDARNCRGSMKFFKGKGDVDSVIVTRYVDDMEYVSKGTFTVDEENKTISFSGEGVAALYPSSYNGGLAEEPATNVRILSLTEKSMQMVGYRSGDNQALSFNYVTALYKYGYTAKLTCYDGNDDNWASATLKIPGDPSAIDGKYTLTFKTDNPRSGGIVYVLDIEGFAAAYPNAIVTIDEIKADGSQVLYDASKFFYGDLEGYGKYRVELFNIWGCGHTEKWDAVADSPFRSGGGEVSKETALAFNSTFEVTFTVKKEMTSLSYPVNLVTINPGWGGTWGYNAGQVVNVIYENNRYRIDPTTLNFKYESDAHAAGSIMTYFQIDGFPFKQPSVTFNGIRLDGVEQTGYDASKIINSEDSGNYRYELWNCYGATKGNCAFGTANGDVMESLAFSQSMEISFTMNSLFTEPAW